MSSRGFHNLPVELALGCVRFMDSVSISRFSRTCKSLYHVLHDKRQETAKEFALLPTGCAPRCPEMPEFQNWRFIPRWFTHPKPSESHVEMAVIENRMDSLRAFLAAGVDPNSFGTGGRRLLGTAIWYGRLDAMNVLFEYTVDIDLLLHQDPPEETLNISSALRYACAYGMFGIGIHLSWEEVVDYEVDLISPLLHVGCKPDAIGY
ncbi:hypothetical protein N8T08_009038 [Aspergillus melleus]|uniref:Uncharacterized protein n=1 Tax=Aspergillus melleus TaxID=138277 RepID=A0ACC3AV39_9EURO|nr:hypothetical protein N8T08_009038 [Aspergillus melleus]